MPRVVVIGTGFGRRSVAPLFQTKGWDTDILSPHDPLAINAALKSPCDLVSIHSPPFMHLDHVRLAAAHGRNILCDKPFGLDTAQAEEMLALATNAGILHFLNFEFRHDPLRQKLKSLIETGALGTPTHLSMTAFMSHGRGQSHRWLFEKDCGGWLGAYGSHAIDFLQWLFGSIESVGGIARTDIRTRPDTQKPGHMQPSTAEDAFTAWFRMQSGVTAMLDTAFAAPVSLPAQTILFCREGTCHITDMSDLTILRPGQPPEHLAFTQSKPDPVQHALGLWLSEVTEAVMGHRQIGPDFNDGLACVRVLDALRRTLVIA